MYITLCGVVVVVTSLTGLGMYEANAIQFGMDQMLGASSEQLSSFIQWYFWCVNVGPLIMYYGLDRGIFMQARKIPDGFFRHFQLETRLSMTNNIIT